jgi:hypothetical protein
VRTVLHLRDAQRGHELWRETWQALKPWLLSGHRFEIDVRPERRTTEQNSLLWALLTELSQQVVWYGQTLTAEEWKWVLSAALKKQRVVPGLDGGFVVLGQSTSRMSKAELSDLIELSYSFGAQQGVVFHTSER